MKIDFEWVELFPSIRWGLFPSRSNQFGPLFEIFYDSKNNSYFVESRWRVVLADLQTLDNAKAVVANLVACAESKRTKWSVEAVTTSGWAPLWHSIEHGFEQALDYLNNRTDKDKIKRLIMRPADGSRWVMELPPAKPD